MFGAMANNIIELLDHSYRRLLCSKLVLTAKKSNVANIISTNLDLWLASNHTVIKIKGHVCTYMQSVPNNTKKVYVSRSLSTLATPVSA